MGESKAMLCSAKVAADHEAYREFKKTPEYLDWKIGELETAIVRLRAANVSLTESMLALSREIGHANSKWDEALELKAEAMEILWAGKQK